jgi:hypothetical protein
MFPELRVFLAMTVQGVRFQVTAPFCSKGCGRMRRKGGRYCLQCHGSDQRLRKMQKMSEAEILARAVKKLNAILRRFRAHK